MKSKLAYQALMVSAAIVLTLASAVIHSADNVNTLYEDAIARYNNKEFSAAEIQLKNALQQNPNHLPSRLLISRLYFHTGDLPAAEQALQAALEMGAARDQVFALLGNVLLAQRKHQQLLNTLTTPHSSTPEAELVYIFRGRANLELGLYYEAQQNFEQAAALAPDNIEVLLGQSAVMVANGTLQEAEVLIDRAQRLNPESFAVWYEKGLLREASNDIEAAMASYNRALALNPASHKARVARATLYLQTGQFEKTRNDLKSVYETAPHDLNAALIYSQALARLGHIDEAQTVVQETRNRLSRISEKVILEEPLLLRAATLIKYISNEFEQANAYAVQYISIRPNSPQIIKLLATLKLRQKLYDEVIDLLYPLQRIRPNDVEVLALLGEALLHKGNFVQASTVLEKATSIEPANAKLNTRLGLSHFGMGLSENGMTDLKRAFELKSEASISAGVILTQVLLRQGEQAEALKTAQKLIQRQPNNPVLYNLLGAVYLSMKNFEAARAIFGKASLASPGFQGAEYNLALLDIHQKRYRDARSRLNTLFDQNPQSALILVALSDLELAEGNVDLAISWLVKATALKVSSPQAMAKLADLYMETGAADEALKQANKMLKRYPGYRDTLLVLGRAQMNKKMLKAAMYTFQKATREHSYSGATLIQIAAYQTSLQDYNKARYTLFKATRFDEPLDAQTALIRLELLTNNLDTAQTNALQLTEDPATAAHGQLFLGEIAFRRKEYPTALSAYKASFDAMPSPASALGVFNARFLMGERKQALQWLENWLQQHPQDAVARRSLARTYLSLNEFQKAQQKYERLITDGRSDALVYSRLARIYQLIHDPRARETATQALQMAPHSATVLDIYGWILVTEGEPSAGLNYLREAASRDSDLQIRYHLASALSELGRNDEARIELQAILRSKPEVPWISSVQKLYSSLETNPVP
ncbi:MAG: XrtA/PEP-CTERM system TPR-repeat protein PrsT [Motiliproteus sp.]